MHHYVSVDQKVQVWQRITYRVEASTIEEAKEKVASVESWNDRPDDIEYSGHYDLDRGEEVIETDKTSII